MAGGDGSCREWVGGWVGVGGRAANKGAVHYEKCEKVKVNQWVLRTCSHFLFASPGACWASILRQCAALIGSVSTRTRLLLTPLPAAVAEVLCVFVLLPSFAPLAFCPPPSSCFFSTRCFCRNTRNITKTKKNRQWQQPTTSVVDKTCRISY